MLLSGLEGRAERGICLQMYLELCLDMNQQSYPIRNYCKLNV